MRWKLLAFSVPVVAGLSCGIADAPPVQPAWDGDWPLVRLQDAPSIIEPSVAFLSDSPQIDGLLDPELSGLYRHTFPYVAKHPQTVDESVSQASYRLAYDAESLYVHIETEAEELTFRDRAYQMGDGFYLILGKAKAGGEPSDQFLAVAGSAVDDPEKEKYRRFIWFDSKGNLFRPLGTASRMESASREGKISFELLLSWSDIYPFHPWLTGELGFNLVLCKALPGEGDGQHRYMIAPDPDQQFEGKPKLYQKLTFEPPAQANDLEVMVQLARMNIASGDPLLAAVALSCPAGSEEGLEIRFAPEEEDSWTHTEAKLACTGDLDHHQIELPTGQLAAGTYKAGWSVPGGEWHELGGFTVMPSIDFDSLRSRVGDLGEGIMPGSRTTLLLHMDELQPALGNLDPHESYSTELLVFERLSDILERMELGEDVVAARTGLFRRGFRSEIDSSIQPYAIIVPEDFNADRKYPLLVFLHGSGETEYALPGFKFITPGDFIVIAPRARGTAHDFHPDEAQRDIAEAIDDAIANYPVDEDRIVLTGFSMGGYGVYRTFFERPGRFRALAVFSGTHAGRYHQEEAPDFFDEESLVPFRDIPVFVFHGEDDLNCPYKEAVELVGKLKEVGAQVEFVSEKGTGHERPDDQSIHAYHQWLRRILMS